ncbi:ABC transporter substrate-binding protein [Butyricicoccus sp.]|uniref:ABC transporter substrate-binding protein n=1 Tax=Butyricicoccus sp. TaxID=2049021 RepID=UPI003F176D60
MKMKRMMAAVLAAAMGVTMLAGCGSSSDSGSGTASSGGNTDTLSVKIWDANQKNGIQTICDEWTEQSGISVEVEVVDWDNYWTLLEAGASGGEMPDVFWMHSNNIQKYMDAELLLDLNDYIAADDAIDMDNYYSDIVELYTQDDGTHYGIPKDYDTIALWYNKTMFDEAGIAYPDNTWTWDDLYDNAKALTKADGSQYGLTGNTDSNQEFYYNVISSYGGYVINDDHTKSGYDNEKTIEAMEMVGKLVKDTMPAQSVMAETGDTDIFTSGISAMALLGSWRVASLKEYDNASEWGVTEIPYYDANGNGSCDDGERVSIYNGLAWSASADCKDPDAAYSLISYLCSEEGQTRQAELGVTMSAYMGTSDEWVNSTDLWDLSPYLDVTEDGSTLVMYAYSRSATWAEEAKQYFVNAWNDPSTMADVCKQVADMMNAELAEEQQ